MTPSERAAALAALASGRVVAVATETFFGLLADASSADAVARVFDLKGRDAGKASALLVPDAERWRGWVREVPPAAARLASAFWPGPLSIALEAAEGVDQRLVHEGRIAARVPGPSDAASLVHAFGRAVTATSANLAGQPPSVNADEVRRAFAAADDLLLVEGQAPGGAPSTVVVFDGERWSVARHGAITESDLRRALG